METLGKRNLSSKGKYDGGSGDTFVKKRDAKDIGGDESSRTRETESRPAGAPKDNEYTSFPEIHERTRKVLKAKGYRNLFPIQKECFYPMYNRHDIIARDLTGSGKTIAFGLPLIEYLRKNDFLKTGKLQAIMLAPTRELAIQITGEISKLKHSVEEFRIVTVYGGVSVQNQANALKSGADLFVGTTGRVLDHIERGNIDFSDVKTVILDEADVMLKMGFKDDVEKILGKCRSECKKDLQVCLFSATIPEWVKEIANEHMRQDFRVIDLAQDLTQKTARCISHLAIDCPFHERLDALSKVLSCYGGTGRIIVFTSTKADANSLLLSDKITHDVEAMHGDIAQNQREVTMKRFREGKFQVLVATDVASRGLDIPEVELVIQLDPPKDTESYIHRSGRTARAGRSGTCITFYNQRSEEFVDRIEELAGVKLERVGIPTEEDMVKANTKGILKRLLDVDMEVLPLFEDTADLLINQHQGDASKALQIALAFCSGHYKQAIPTESLINGQRNLCTLKMSAQEGKQLGAQACFAIIYKYWAPRIQESIKRIRPFQDGTGVVFDIRTQWVEAFLDNFEHLKNGDKQVDFDVSRAKSIPPCGPDEEKREREPREDGGHGGGGGGYDNQGGDGGSGRKRYGDRDNRDGGGYGGGGGGGGGRSGRDRGGDDRRQGGGGGGGYSGGGGGGGGGSGWNIDGNYSKPEFDDEYRKPEQYPSYGGGSTYGGSTSYSNKVSAPSTPSYNSQENRGGQQKQQIRYNDFSNNPSSGRITDKAVSSTSGPVIYLTNLNFSTNEQDIMSFLKDNRFNPVRAKLLYDSEGRSKGTGFVQMSSASEAQQAIDELSNTIFEGRKLIINIANQQVRQSC